MSWLGNLWNGVSSWFGDNAGSLINTAVNGVTNWLGLKQQNENVDKQLEAQAAENQATRDYNYQLWHDENAYNAPAAQKARLEQAGLNSDLMYGGSGVMNTASSPAPASPMDWSALSGKRTAADAVSQHLDNQLKQAQINKLASETEGQYTQNDILASDAKFREAWNKGQLDTIYSTINLQGKQADEATQNVKESQSRIQKINAEVETLGMNIKQIANSIKNDNARLNMEKLRNSAELRESASRLNLNNAQCKRLIDEWEYLVQNYQDGHSVSILNQGYLEVQNHNLRMEGKMTYGDYDSHMSTWENVLKFLNQITSFALPFIKK